MLTIRRLLGFTAILLLWLRRKIDSNDPQYAHYLIIDDRRRPLHSAALKTSEKIASGVRLWEFLWNPSFLVNLRVFGQFVLGRRTIPVRLINEALAFRAPCRRIAFMLLKNSMSPTLRRFWFLDDERHTVELRKLCKIGNIEAVGYMHGKICRRYTGLKFPRFNEYHVWGQGFASRLIGDFGYTPSQLIYTPKKTVVPDYKSENFECQDLLCVVGESNVNVDEIWSVAKRLANKLRFRMVFCPKTQEKVPREVLKAAVEMLPFVECCMKYPCATWFGTHSTTLLEVPATSRGIVVLDGITGQSRDLEYYGLSTFTVSELTKCGAVVKMKAQKNVQKARACWEDF